MARLKSPWRQTCAALALAGCLPFAQPAGAQPQPRVLELAQQQKQPLMDTLKSLVEIESGSRDTAGLARLADLIAGRLRALGAHVDLVDVNEGAYRMEDTPPKIGQAVRATCRGTGQKKVLMIAHMDTVYQTGQLAKQPFRVDGDRAYGLAIADDKQGIAVILHTMAMLKALDFKDFGTLTVLINGDEEISSPGSRGLLTRLGAEHDLTMSFEATRTEDDKLALATAGIAAINLKVTGKASHAGNAPERGVNALYELSHQLLQARDLSDKDKGVKVNWTIAKAGSVRNMIPADAEASADVRVLRVADYDGVERAMRERVQKKLLPDTKVDITFERRRPPLEAPPASQAVGRHAQAIYTELGRKLNVDANAEGGGTDAAFAALQTKNAVIERFGLQGFGAHSANDEYVLLDSIEPRLYLATRLIMDFAQGKVKP